MTTQASINTTAIEVVGQYHQAAQTLVDAYRAGTERVVGGLGERYIKLVNDTKLPVSDNAKEKLVNAEERAAGFVIGSVTRACERAQAAIERAANGASNGISFIDEKTTWANDMAVLNALRPVHLRAATLSLKLAEQVAKGASLLSERVYGGEGATEEAPVKKRAARKPTAKRAPSPPSPSRPPPSAPAALPLPRSLPRPLPSDPGLTHPSSRPLRSRSAGGANILRPSIRDTTRPDMAAQTRQETSHRPRPRAPRAKRPRPALPGRQGHAPRRPGPPRRSPPTSVTSQPRRLRRPVRRP